ncbi:glycine-rich protein [Musa troglodytarum]|uniref:Glycine-rich protein n=1 Tax=Musa troglodytarum TaxID=320322 RepID=A0A9E7ETP3_9LILI|nr:glycine-rich protein [Musa troglodytarum]
MGRRLTAEASPRNPRLPCPCKRRLDLLSQRICKAAVASCVRQPSGGDSPFLDGGLALLPG